MLGASSRSNFDALHSAGLEIAAATACSDRATSRRAACVSRRRRCRGVAANGVAGVKPGTNSPVELVPRGRLRLRPAINVVRSPTHEIYLIKPPLIVNAGTSARAPRPPRHGGRSRGRGRRAACARRPRRRVLSARQQGHTAYTATPHARRCRGATAAYTGGRPARPLPGLRLEFENEETPAAVILSTHPRPGPGARDRDCSELVLKHLSHDGKVGEDRPHSTHAHRVFLQASRYVRDISVW